MKKRTIALISCVGPKSDRATKAINLYNSPLFNKCVNYCMEQKVDDIYILSAKYGLVHQSEIIEPYEMTLNNMRLKERNNWHSKVMITIKKFEDIQLTSFLILAGSKYRERLVDELDHYSIPMQGLGIGKQLQWLNQNTKHTNLITPQL